MTDSVCPECGKNSGGSAPPLLWNGWTWTMMVVAAAAMVVLGCRVFTSATHTAGATKANKTLFIEPQALGTTTIGSLRKWVDAGKNPHLSSAAAKKSLSETLFIRQAGCEKECRVVFAVAQTPFLYRTDRWQMGWPARLVRYDVSSDVVLFDSKTKGRRSLFAGDQLRLYWLGFVSQWISGDHGFLLEVTWAAIWVAWSIAACGLVLAAALLRKRARCWAFASLFASVLFLLSVLWPRHSVEIQSPIGAGASFAMDLGFSLAEFDELASTSDGQLALARRILDLTGNEFRWEPQSELSMGMPRSPVGSASDFVGRSPPIGQMVTASPEVIPMIGLQVENPWRSIGSTSWKSFYLETIRRTEFVDSRGNEPAQFDISSDISGFVHVLVPTPAGAVRFSVWMTRLAVDIGTLLAIPSAVILFPFWWAHRTARKRVASGACLWCGYDLVSGQRQPSVP